MSLYSYQCAQELGVGDFYALIMAAMLRADDTNLAKLRREWPTVHVELKQRYNAPQGLLPGECNPVTGDTREQLDELRRKVGLDS